MEHSYTQVDIDKYLRKEMDSEVQIAFEATLATNKNLQDNLAATKLLQESLQVVEEATFLENLQAHQQSLTAKGFFLEETDLDELIMKRVTEEEAQKIQQKIKDDDQFKVAYEERKHLQESLTVLEENRVIDLIKEVGATSVKEEIIPPTKSSSLRISSIRRVLSIAAAFALMAIGIWWMYPKTVAPETLYVDNFKPFKSQNAYPALRRTSFSKPLYHSDLAKADDAYILNDYKTAIELFEKYFADAPITDVFYTDATLHYANVLMQQNEYPKAIIVLKKIFNNTKNEQAGWYLALCYLKMGELDKVKSIFQKIPTGDYSSQLNNLIKKIPNKN